MGTRMFDWFDSKQARSAVPSRWRQAVALFESVRWEEEPVGIA